MKSSSFETLDAVADRLSRDTRRRDAKAPVHVVVRAAQGAGRQKIPVRALRRGTVRGDRVQGAKRSGRQIAGALLLPLGP